MLTYLYITGDNGSYCECSDGRTFDSVIGEGSQSLVDEAFKANKWHDEPIYSDYDAYELNEYVGA